MARWTGTWLSGLGAAGVSLRPEGSFPGQRFGLPAEGAGAVATFGRRLLAFVVDAVLSALVAGLFTAPHAPREWSLLPLAVLYIPVVALAGQTPGMRLLGLRLVRLGPDARVDVLRAAGRYVLLALLVPALIGDRDGRGLHDRAVGTVVVRA
jgi:uncharacterized RDD family membrane protein YckC